ncbi:MAG TPA: protease complex subunit PrcB family protein [Nitrospirota bacterium]|nr:protease complex subunit PrcB family protein [Nitrospirota bacterium]
MAPLGWTAAFVMAITLLLVISNKYDQGGTHGKLLEGVEILYYSIECGRSERESAVTWITNTNQLDQTYADIRKNILGAEPENPPLVNFEKDGVLFIEMGQRSTTGYQLIIEEKPISVNNSIVDVNISWIEPSAGSIQAQVITSPCALIKFPTGDYSHFRVLDQNNQVRVETLKNK